MHIAVLFRVHGERYAVDAFMAGYLALHLIDWGQTLYIADNPKIYSEINPIIGAHPTRERVNQYFLMSGATIYLADKAIKKRHSKLSGVFRVVLITTQFAVVQSNYRIGIKIGF